MADPLADYSHERVNALLNCGATRVLDLVTEDIADGKLLQIEAALVFGEREAVHLYVSELLCVKDGDAHRQRYSYQFISSTGISWRYERDAVNHPEMPEHKHVGEGPGEPWARVTLGEVLNEVHDAVIQVEERLAKMEDAGNGGL